MTKTIKKELLELSDKKYKKFQSNLCPKTTNILGIRVPVLRNYAKKLAKNNEIEKLLKEIDDEYYEETMLKGMLIGLNNKEFGIIKKEIEEFVPKINNWAVCDVFCAGLKIVKNNKNEMWDLIQKYLKSNKEFEIRFAVVIILNYYIEENYLEKNFKIFDSITSKEYYVQMAVAWAISICFVKFYDKTLKYIENCNLDKFTYNKSIQKAIESYRITPEQKEYLRTKKRG